MKKVLMLMLVLAAGTASFANQSIPQTAISETRVLMTAEHKIKLYVPASPTKGQLAILDANGQAMYKTTVALQKGLSQQFDFAGLDTGTYRLTLTTDKETLTRTFVVQASPNESFIVQES